MTKKNVDKSGLCFEIMLEWSEKSIIPFYWIFISGSQFSQLCIKGSNPKLFFVDDVSSSVSNYFSDLIVRLKI